VSERGSVITLVPSHSQHTSYCSTTSRTAAATQTRAGVSPAMHSKMSLTVRKTVTMKPISLNIEAQDLPTSLSNPDLSPYICLRLSSGLWPGCKPSGLVESITRIEVAQHYTSYTHQSDGDAQHYTLALPLRLCIGPDHDWGRSQHWYVMGAHANKERKKPLPFGHWRKCHWHCNPTKWIADSLFR